MSALEELAVTEAKIERIVGSVEGSMDEKTARLEALGVFERYSRIFSSYLALAEPPRSDLEALKRATFLAWYELVEPPCFTGVAELPGDAGRRIVELLEARVAELDEELRWMLAWYYFIADYAFPALGADSELAALLESEDREGWLARRSEAERMRGRGLMGCYWLAVLAPPGQGNGEGRDRE